MPSPLSDGALSFEGGVQSGLSPSLLTPTQLAWAVNCTMRDGYLGPRPGFVRHSFAFESESTRFAATDGKFQGAGVHQDDNCNTSIVWAVDGRLFALRLNSGNSVTEITPWGKFTTASSFTVPNVGYTVSFSVSISTGISIGDILVFKDASFKVLKITFPVPPTNPDGSTKPVTVEVETLDGRPGISFGIGTMGVKLLKGNPAVDQYYFEQAERYLVVQDTENRPVLWNGIESRRAGKDEVPTGGAMAYGKGRLWVSQGLRYYGGDLVNSDPAYGRDTVIRFTENTYQNEGGGFRVSGGCGGITGMAFSSNIDTALGQGDLMIFTEDSIFAFDAPADRTTWKSLNYPLQRFALHDYGATSHRSIASANGDLFFRAEDGIRSFVYARRNFQDRWDNTPLSQEVTRVLNWDSSELLYAASAANFDRRLLMTVGPELTARGVVHRGLASLNFSLVGSMGKELPPIWEGVWTGLRILQVLKLRMNGTERCFIFALDSGDRIELWELTKASHFDDGDKPIEWIWETKSYQFSAPLRLKRLQNAQLWADRFDGTVRFASYWTNNQHPCWAPWVRWKECATTTNACETWPPLACTTLLNTQEQFRTQMSLGLPPEIDDTVQQQYRHIGFEFQLRMEISGYCRIKQVRMNAEYAPERPYGELKGDEVNPS